MTAKADQPHSAIGRDVARVMTVLARAVRARPLYAPNNEVLVLMMKDLERAFFEVFKMIPEIVLKVRPDALLFEDEVVYTDHEAQQSLPFVLYRDGIRRLEFHRELEIGELDVLLGAAQQGMSGRTMEDDVVSYLWRHQLHHIRYLTVDVTVTDTQVEADLDQQIDGLLRAIYGDGQDDVGPKSINLDGSDLAAKSIADALDSMDVMAPGFHFARQAPAAPIYAQRHLEEAAQESEQLLTERLVEDTLAALEERLDEADQRHLAEALLRILDATLLNEQLGLGARIIEGMRSLEAWGPFLAEWLVEATSEARIRQVTIMCQTNPQLEEGVIAFLSAAGQRSVPSLLGALPSFTNPEQRRRFADLAVELGIEDDSPVRELLTNEQAFVAREALYIMGALGLLRDRMVLKEVQNHPRPQVRLAVLGAVDKMPWDVAQAVITDLLRDPEPRVAVAAAEELANRVNDLSLRAIENAVDRPEFEDLPPTVKRAFLRCYAILHQSGAIDRLSGYVAAAEAWRVRRPVEESAEAAISALASLKSQPGVEALKKAALSRSKSVREAARSALERLKAGKA